jgi:hypothetical protein
MKDFWRKFASLLAASAVLALVLTWVSGPRVNFENWLSFFAVLGLSTALIYLIWKLTAQEAAPKWLLWLIVGAALLRLALGIFWQQALPAYGYDTPVQQAGYVMEDAYKRDRAAWELAQSDLPISEAFRGYSGSDQYGGLLFLSAGLYRYIGSAAHQALLVLVLAATASSLAVLFTWLVAKKLWGGQIARLAAWGLAIYPEALLLGSSQMREAFSVTLVMAALYALLRAKEQASPRSWLTLLLPVALSLILSPPFTLSVIGLLVLVYVGMGNWSWLQRHKTWIWPTVVLITLGFAYLITTGKIDLWIVQSAEWQAYVSANASGWVTRQFEKMPLWSQIPFLLIYGVFRPLLPAALIADGLPVWRGVAIWRALGWTVLLAFLIYASYLAIRNKRVLKSEGALLLSNWVVVLVASYRGGGDLWDNPRYRSAFAGVQFLVAAWAWSEYRKNDDPWLKRAFGGALLMVAWFIPWYLRRYATIGWPVFELHQVVGLGLVSAVLYVIWDWLAA